MPNNFWCFCTYRWSANPVFQVFSSEYLVEHPSDVDAITEVINDPDLLLRRIQEMGAVVPAYHLLKLIRDGVDTPQVREMVQVKLTALETYEVIEQSSSKAPRDDVQFELDMLRECINTLNGTPHMMEHTYPDCTSMAY